MGTTATAMIGEASPAIVERLDSLHAYHQLAAMWTDAVRLRLEGPAAYLLPDELAVAAEASRAAAGRVADRLGDLGAAPTADPALLVDVSPLTSFELPTTFSDVGAILRMALEQLQTIIRTYGSFLRTFSDADPVSAQLVVDLLGAETQRETQIESVL